MNREIKFRAQRKDNGEFVYGSYSDMSDIVSSWVFIEFANNGQRERHIVVPETVGQFTGLKDKNGVDIYEGDIIKTERNIVFVHFGNKEYLIKIYDDSDVIEVNGWLVTNQNGHTETLDSSICEGEVIGNIHSNPELIK